MDEQSRASYISVAVSQKDREALSRLGSSFADLRCPECHQAGARFGDLGSELAFDGFVQLSDGGPGGVICRCTRCAKEVVLPLK